MVFTEERGNLFNVDNKYFFAHCVSVDCGMGAGIAVQFQRLFKLRNTLKSMSPKVGDALRVDRVFNLFTKEKYWQKPTYDSLRDSLNSLKQQCLALDVKYLAIPFIGSGLDRLSWLKVREIIQDVFSDTDIEILARYL